MNILKDFCTYAIVQNRLKYLFFWHQRLGSNSEDKSFWKEHVHFTE